MFKRVALALVLLVVAPAAVAAVFRDVQYLETTGVDPALQRLDVYTPDAPGPQPVLVILHGGGDKGALPFPAASLTARGYVVASIRTRPSTHDGAGADALAGLSWVRAHASGYGGDRERMVLIGTGDGVAPAAALVTGTAAPPIALRGMVLLDAAPLEAMTNDAGPIAARVPPVLVLREHLSVAAPRAGERWSDRVRGGGTSVQVLPRDARAADDTLGYVLAWLAALEVPRVQRFETMTFAAQPLAPGARVAGLATHAFSLFALSVGADHRLRILRRDAADGPWIAEHDASGAADARYWMGRVGRELVVLAAAPDGWRSFVRDASGPQWTATTMAAAARTPASIVAAAHTGRDGNSELFVVVGRSRAVRVHQPATGAPVVRELTLPSGRVTALASIVGVLYAATAPARELGPALWRFDEEAGAWQAIRGLPPAERAITHIAAVPDVAGTTGHALLLAAGGRLLRVVPRDQLEPTLELDLARTFADLWGSLGGDGNVALAGAPLPLRHPETGDLVHVAALRLVHPDRTSRGAYFLVRQQDGRYAYGLASDFGAKDERGAPLELSAGAASPFVSDSGAAMWFGGGDAVAPLLAGRLRWAGPARGLWWDRTRSGNGLALEPTAEGHTLILYTYARDGSPTWYVAHGDLAGQRFVADPDGLSRPAPTRAPRPESVQAVRVGDVSLRFGATGNEPPCAGADRRDALALAILEFDLDGQAHRWCVEPFAFAGAGTPDVAVRGLWAPESDAEDWGLSLSSQGPRGATRLVAVAFHFDASGQPRWVLGAGPVRNGEAELALSTFTGACPGCEARIASTLAAGALGLRFRGWCGEVRGEVALDLAYPGPDGGRLRRDALPLVPRSLAGCY